jgi:cytidylate kinase
MPGVTVSASYGAGGSAIARRVAKRLGYPMLDRAISAQIADQLQVSVDEAASAHVKRSLAERFFAILTPLAGGVVGAEGSDALPVTDYGEAAVFRSRAEELMRSAVADGVVILGRAGAAALRDEPDVLRVRLFGPAERREARAARIEGVTPQEAARRRTTVDAARAEYVRRLYGCDIDDPVLYHLHVDSTVLSVDTCVNLISAAFEDVHARAATPA